MPVYRIDLAYDGGGFHGYARQPDVRTVQGDLEAALERVTGPIRTSVAGRTDAGVHAQGQVVSMTVDEPLDAERLARSLNRMLNPEIVVWSVKPAPNGFDARSSALSRTYRYRVLNQPLPDPLRRHVVWHVADPLDVVAMNEAAASIIGRHDFASFCRSAPGRPTVRDVLAAEWAGESDMVLRFEISAASFCHQMVRSLVALGVEIGRGRVPAHRVPEIVAARDRNAARGAAPPQGLVLWTVAY